MAVLSRQHWMSIGLLVLSSFACWAQKPELVVQTGHLSAVDSPGAPIEIAFSPDGLLLASGGSDNTIKLWEVATGKQLRSLEGHGDRVSSIAFSPDGKIIASGSGDITIKLWEVASGKQLWSLESGGSIDVVAFSPDGKVIASSNGTVIELWDARTGKQLRSIGEQRKDLIGSIAFSPDGSVIVSGDAYNRSINLWEVSTGKRLRSLEGYRSGVRSVVAFSPNGKVVASGGDGLAVKLWDTLTGNRLLSIEAIASVISVAFSPNGKVVAACGGSGIELWDSATGKRLFYLETLADSVVFSSDGTMIASGADSTITVWRAATGKPVLSLKGHVSHVNSVAFSPDRRMIASGGADNTIKLWDVMTGTQLQPLRGHTRWVSSIAFSPDGRIIASGSADNTIKLHNTTTEKQLHSLEGHAYTIWSVVFSSDGNRIASCSLDDSIRLWDTVTGDQVYSVSDPGVRSIAFSPDGKVLVNSGLYNVIRLRNATTGEQLLSINGDSSSVGSAVIFSPDGKIIASGGYDRIKLWDATTGNELRYLEGHGGPNVPSIAFSPDGKVIASVSYEGIGLWETATGKLLRSLTGHANSVQSVAFGPEGKTILSGSRDGEIKLWDVQSGKELASLISIDQDDWLVVTPEGLFDGSPNGWKQILWRFNNNTFDHAPVEAFFKEYWRPGLLADIMAGRPVEPPSMDLSKIDIRQPHVRITSVDGQLPIEPALGEPVKLTDAVGDRQVEIKVEVVDNTTTPSRNDIPRPPSSGAKDLRLFHNGSLVKLWPGDVFEKEKSGCEPVATKPSEPRRAICKAAVSIIAGDNNFTAYAFNHDNVKSSDNRVIVKGADNLKRTGTAYIIAVGVNEYANKDYNLRYAVADAEDFGTEIKRQQESLKQYERVEVIQLYDKDATKENILLALKLLSGTDQLRAGAPEAMKKIKKAEPEDLVMVYFAGHGTARENQFYLIPHDLGYDGSQKLSNDEALKLVLYHSISDRDLQDAFEKVDAGRLLLVIDACNSGQALESEEKRRGPMNSKGLAQLAYEKGMYVLTASQSNKAALEVSELQHGLLTYVLVEEGLKQAKAEKNDKGEVIEREWFDYASRRVPEMQLEKMKQRHLEIEKQPATEQGRGAELFFVETDNSSTDPEKRSVQRPRVFYRRELETKPLIVSRP